MGRSWLALGVVLSVACAGSATRARADVRPVVAVEVGLSLAEPSLLVGIEGGIRVDGQWTFLLELDWNPWLSLEGPAVRSGALNIGVGVEHIYQDGLLRSALFIGTSTLLYETALDQPGATGAFIDIVPISVRIPLERDVVTLRLDPVSMHLLAPVLSGIPLIRYEFRHVLSLEVTP